MVGRTLTLVHPSQIAGAMPPAMRERRPIAPGSGCPHMVAMAIQIRTSLAEPETGETFVPHKPTRPDKAEGGKAFQLVADYEPAGDQPTAIRELVEGIGENGEASQVLLGV